VVLIVDRPEIFRDNWIYVHDPDVKVGRIQNFKNWSPDMVPVSHQTALGLEYFCNEGDELWAADDHDLIERGKREVAQLGLARFEEVKDGCVVRVAKAYPVYDSDYREHLQTIRAFVEKFENFQTIGRNGLHRYNNQDHAMVTGLLAARNVALAQRNDVWSVNTDEDYHEEIREAVIADAATPAFAKLDRIALGLSIGTAFGLLMFLATLSALIDQTAATPNLGLLGQFFPGYTVTWMGSILGLVYGLVLGFVGGWIFALIRNITVFGYMAVVHHRAERQALRRVLDYF